MEDLALAILMILLPLIIIVIILSVIEIIGMWKVFKKAGKNGWEAIIPYYNTWTLVEISGCVWWFFLIVIITSITSIVFSNNIINFINYIANIVVMYLINYNIAKKFGKDYGYAIGLTLIPFVFYPMLGFGNDKFDNNLSVSPYGAIKKGEI